MLLDQGFGYRQIGEQLGIKPRSVGTHVERIASLIPGEALPARAKIIVWFRGASAGTLA